MNKIVTTATATIISLQALMHSYIQSSQEYPKPIKRDEVLKNYQKYEGMTLKDYMEIYDDPDININWNLKVNLPVNFVDEVLKNGISDGGKFLNLFYNLDRYNAIRQNGNEYKVIIYDIDESKDVVEDSMIAKAKELKYDLISNPRTLMYIGKGSVSLGLDINGLGIGILRYEGDSLETRMNIEAFIEVNMWGDIMFAIGSLFSPSKYSKEAINKREKLIQEDLNKASSIINSDSSDIYIDRAYKNRRISEDFWNKSKQMLKKLNQNNYKTQRQHK